ncbi:hypothetical protein MPH_04093 [Macrophomina phaseolina MS6]|uniref:Mfs allantoate protein n=1 Tax=Macrophomina phaseolina (strain MS6) TaxID=1126212 RepID=K2SPD8_MACPH|nr:hypothetical protein MPH_04093 [Macrophomina phaseolina MS6]
MAPQCQALNLSDERRCTGPATNANGLFCHFHSRQVYGLYKGYKRRNAQLNYLIAHPPPFLRKQGDTPLSKVDFSAISDEQELKTLHDHLFERHALLDRVIRARKLHHSRFYALELDYGHQHYLDHLQSQKHTVLRTLERVERRTAEVLYEKQKWFKWVRELEDAEEKARDAEKKKVKQEAALLKRHWKEVEARMREMRAREQQKREDEFLDKALEERRRLDEESADEEWDPIEDVVEDERGNYISLLRLFLWHESARDESSIAPDGDKGATSPPEPAADKENMAPGVDAPENAVEKAADAPKSRSAKKRARQKAKAAEDQELQGHQKPGEVHVESRDKIRQRLREGQKVERASGWKLRGTVENPAAIVDRMPPVPDEEIDTLLAQIYEIKQLLFCRLVLSHAALLPAALRANSIDEFLSDEEVTNTDLRDLCLKMEQPGLQELRDACADLDRGENEDDDDGDDDERQVIRHRSDRYHVVRARDIPRSYQTKREKALMERRAKTLEGTGGAIVDFGSIDDQGQYHIRKIRVKVCGKWIYNYPSEKAMSRGGWLQFSIMAKDYSLFDAVSLCRNWDEFFELSILATYQYFPSGNWATWVGDQMRQQVLQLMEMADKYTVRSQTGSRSHYGRQHQILEARNFICACVKRNDAVSRRFIQYVVLQTNSMVILVRDVKTGDVLYRPPGDQLWLVREKSGMGRASRNEWNVIKQVDPNFFEEMDRHRQWHFNFKEYYDVIIWDLDAGCHFSHLYNNVQTALIKAHRFHTGLDLYRPSEHILRTITRDKETQRTRDIKPGEEGKVPSIWDDINSDNNRVKFFTDDAESADELQDDMPTEWKYNEADRLEDEVLFPWEQKRVADAGEGKAGDIKPADAEEELLASQGRMHRFESLGPNFKKWAYDLDTDDEVSDFEYNSTEDSRDEKYAEIDKSASLADTIIARFGVSVQDEKLSEEERFQATAKELGFPGASSWEELWSNVLELKPATPADNLEFMSLIRQLSPFGQAPGQSAAEESMVVAKRPKEKKLTKSQIKALALEDFNKDFEIHIDRERAACFKDCWHRADVEPGAQQRWANYKRMVAELQSWELPKGRTPASHIKRVMYGMRLLAELGIDQDCHRRIKRDMHLSNAMTSIFFGKYGAFFNSESGLNFKSSPLLNQAERAKNPPDIRTPHSNKTRPKEHWKEWDDISKTQRSRRQIIDYYPEHWNLIVRPTVAHLYREGVICPSYCSYANGPAISLTEPTRPGKPDLFFDWRLSIPEVRLPPTLQDPFTIEPLVSHARRFAKNNPGAVFSALKLWSPPHFWPLMLGIDNRDNTSFTDGAGRTWEWKFIPKDMPFSEWSIHQSARMRIEPYRHFFGKKVVCRKDMFLIMGKDKEECKKLTTAAMWAINTRPWRLEVDPWKSWWGVGLEFLEGLDDRWWQ